MGSPFNLPITGITCALFCFISLSGVMKPTPIMWKSDPTAKSAVSQARAHMKKARWDRAAVLLSAHANASNPIVLLELGKLLSRGWGIPRSLDKARDTLLVAVQHDFPKRGQAAFELAKVFQKSTDEDCERLAFEWFSKSVLWGFGKAHGDLGRHYARGIAVDQNMQKALHHYQLAAQYGSAKSLLSFIHLLQREPNLGNGLPATEILLGLAVPQLEIEALNGKSSSAKALGRLYLRGRLIPPNKTNAELWLRRSANMGNSGAMADLAKILLSDTPSKIEIQQALKLLETAGRLHDGGAQTASGRLYLSGKHGLDPNRAIVLFQRGIDNAHPGAMLEMAKLLLLGKHVEKNVAKALKLLKRGASLGHKGSKRLLQKTRKKLKQKPNAQSKLGNRFSNLQHSKSDSHGRPRRLSGATYQH